MGTSGRSSSSPIPRQPTYLRDLLALPGSLSTRLRPFYECRQAPSISFTMAGRGLFSLVSLILVAGGLLLMFFILLAGAVDGSPLNKFYFLQANTGNIPCPYNSSMDVLECLWCPERSHCVWQPRLFRCTSCVPSRSRFA